MIQKVNSSKEIEMIILDAIHIAGIDVEVLKKMISDSLLENKFIIADIDNGQMKAFMFATVESLDGQEVCFIQACHSVKNGSVQVMLDKCIEWSKKLGLEKIIFMTKRNPRAWERKYKFNEIYHVMAREI